MKQSKKQRAVSLLLAVILCLGLVVPAMAAPAGENLPDWYFLFAIFTNVDADGKDGNGVVRHTKYTMTQEEIDLAWNNAREFSAYMNQVGVMNAHVDVIEIDTPITGLTDSDLGSYFDAKNAAPLLKGKVDLDQYDQVISTVSLNISTGYLGMTGSSFDNGTGHSCVDFRNRDYGLRNFTPQRADYPKGTYVHEFLHIMERMSKIWGATYDSHTIRDDFYKPTKDDYYSCYTDMILNRVKGNAETGTGVFPAAWRYSPRTLRTTRELTGPSGAAAIGDYAFRYKTNLERVTVPSGAARIGYAAFGDCTALTEVTMMPGVTSIGDYAFYKCASLSSVTIPASVTSIGYAAFWGTSLKDVYYTGTQAQWNSIRFGEYNSVLTGATIHYNSPAPSAPSNPSVTFTDVPSWCANEADWAVANGITKGTGGNQFTPFRTCTDAEILTFLWRANGSPKPTGSNPFSNVKAGDYYSDAAIWAYENGMVPGGTFNGNSLCTRSKAVTYIWKAAGSPPAKAANFTDVSSGAAYAQAVAWAVQNNVTNGTGGGKFSPNATCTRSEIVTFLYRAQAA